MPSGIYKRTKQHIKQAIKNLGEHTQKGHISWNKNLKGWTKNYKNAGFQKGNKINLGRKRTAEAVEKGASKLRGKKRPPLSEEWKKKLREHGFQKGEKNVAKKSEIRKKIREAKINNPNRVFKDTSIESKMEAELKRRNIDYQKQVPLCKIAIVDFYLPEYKIVIQCDGCYYHGCPKHYPKYYQNRKQQDKKQDKVLIFNGFSIYRFWEHEINCSVQKCVDKLSIKYRKKSYNKI